MCGIIGTTDLKVNLEGAHSLLHHRGPDANGSWQNAKIRLCHTRLSIIDLSEAGTQPMITDSGNAIVFNGEIYNYIELKNELIKKGVVFNSGTDTEVILKGFESEGIGFFNKLVGMWAFAIYDNKTAKIILSRDH